MSLWLNIKLRMSLFIVKTSNFTVKQKNQTVSVKYEFFYDAEKVISLQH